VRVLIVSGIFPPDIGGPATHSADLARELGERGHEARVLTVTDESGWSSTPSVVRFPRRWPWPLRSAGVLAWLLRHGRESDVVYATGLVPLAVAGARVIGRPVIVKVVGDPAWERGSRLGLTDTTFDEFQQVPATGARVRAMQWVRNRSIRAATAVVTPSRHLAKTIEGWADRDDVVVVPNGAHVPADATADCRETRAGLDLVFVGRLVPVKQADVLVEAVARVPSARLEIIGDGPELTRLQQLAGDLDVTDRVTFAGALGHDDVMRHLAQSDALVLSSSHEGLPHVLIEALAMGTPVVASRAGGMGEVLTDGVDGLLVDDVTAETYARIFEELGSNRALLARLAAGAMETGVDWRFERCADRLLDVMARVTGPRPRAVFIGKSRAKVPPTPDDQRKYAINERHLHTIVVCTARRAAVVRPAGSTILALPAIGIPVVGSAIFYSVAPLVGLALAAGRQNAVIVCQSPYEAFGTLVLRQLLPRRLRPRVQVELHGDWRTASRLYGSPKRRLMSFATDRIAEWTIRHADRIRPVSEVLADRAREAGFAGPIDRYVAFSDYSTFLDAPLAPIPDAANALFVGVLEAYKAVDVLLDSWPLVLRELPGARLTMVGGGSLRDVLATRIRDEGLEASVSMIPPVPRSELVALTDDSSCLVLPSRSEGLARIVLEVMARGRPVVASRVGGIEEVLDDGVNGRLVEAEDVDGLAAALVDVLGDRERAAAMGDAARRRILERDPLAEYEAGMARLAGWIRGV
jgi:glycosyltransferase involved in cell wall biosynthesis